MKKILSGIAVVAAAMSLQSCLHDDKDLFDTPAAQRIENAVTADKELLESADNGWQMHYYTGKSYTGGGYTMYMKFKGGKAFVSSDIAPADSVSSSSYDVIKDQGPVITFNTFNSLMHFLAEPASGDVDGEQGDYEFVITKTTQDSIYVRGKKWGNEMVMTRVADGVNWQTEIQKIHDTYDSMAFYYSTPGAASSDQFLAIDPDSRRATVGSQDVAFCPTTTGIELQSPVTIDGKTVSTLNYDKATKTLTSADNSLTMNAYIPQGYHDISEYLGNWNFVYYARSNGALKAYKYTFNMKPMTHLIGQTSHSGVYAYFNLSSSLAVRARFSYDATSGTLTFPRQYIYALDDNGDPSLNVLGDYVDGCAALWAVGITNDGYLSTTMSYKVTEQSDGTFKFVDATTNQNLLGIVLLCVDSSGNILYELSDGTITSDDTLVDADEGASLAILSIWYYPGTQFYPVAE